MEKDEKIRKNRLVGRPRILESVEQFEERCEEYFRNCEEEGRPLTVTGLAVAVGLTSREQLGEYEKREEFTYSVKRAKSIVAQAYEEKLHSNSVAGSIFALKCNYKWRDNDDDSLTNLMKNNSVKIEIVKPSTVITEISESSSNVDQVQ